MKKERQRLKSSYRNSVIVLFLTLCFVLALNFILIKRTESDKIETEGQMRLSSIASRVDNSLYHSECLLNSVSMQIEQIISMGGDTAALLDDYFSPATIEQINEDSDGSCFEAYAAYNGELYISDFVPDDSFILDERSWYIGAKRRMGAINVTDPYVDASTGEMCYSMSKLLSDGVTVVGLDFSMSGIQDYIEEMNPEEDGTSLIVSGNGMIVGHSDASLVGSYSGDLDFYKELVNKVFMLYGDSFKYNADGVTYNIFSDKTNYEWYLIVSVSGDTAASWLSVESLVIMIIMVLFTIAIVIFYIRNCHSKQRTEHALEVKNEYLKDMGFELKRPLSGIISRADILSHGGGAGSIAGTEIGDYAKELGNKLDNLISMSAINSFNQTDGKRKKEAKSTNHKGKIMLISAVLFATSIFAIVMNTVTQFQWGNTTMQKETEVYLYQVQEWVADNKAVLDVISHSIAAQPGFEKDYDKAVEYLDSVVSNYDDISVAYLCNPEWEHTVLMNNRWEPDANWHVEERQWYIDTLVSKNNFNISEPYLDEQTGYYCTTLSTIVYDEKGNFIGLLGIDYYLDKLVGILGASYTDTGYAFLTDIDGNILNHPYDDYQMKPSFSVNAANLCYREALSESSPKIIQDYDGRYRVCLALTEEASGFKVIVMKEIYEIYGSGITSDILYLIVFATCIIVVNMIMRRLTQWQEKVNIELKNAAESAISAGKAKNNFLANMSHEIRTPINAVLGMNEMIMREADEPAIIEYASNIQSAGKTLLSIINEILDFSKIESGKMEIVPVEYDVSSLINDLVTMIKPRAQKKYLQFNVEVDESIPVMLYGDDVRIRQVITNILTNAVKYTHEGSVSLRISEKEKNDDFVSLEVSVADTGIGIKEEDLDKLFTSFQRLDQEKNRNIEGTGLGITIVQHLLNMMGSELKVSSVYGTGSTFSFVLEQRIVNAEPVGDFEARFRNAAELNRASSIKIAPEARVLVVDDNETNLVVAKNLLKRTQVMFETASSGKQCINLLKKNLYDIVFLDHMMPEMDGIQTLAVIREQGLAEQTAFIALTANAIHGARQTYIEAGFDDYLSKPFTGVDIEKCLFSHIDRSLVRTIENGSAKQKAASDEFSGSSLEVIDFNKGVAYCGGDNNSYSEVLQMYVKNYEKKAALIRKLLQAESWSKYITEVHALKSSSLTVGAVMLSERAKELETAGKEGNYNFIEEKNEELLELYGKVAAAGSAYLGKTEDKAADETKHARTTALISTERARKFIDIILSSCEAFDGDRIIEICDYAVNCSVGEIELRPLFEPIKLLAVDFDFEAAAEKARLAAEKLK